MESASEDRRSPAEESIAKASVKLPDRLQDLPDKDHFHEPGPLLDRYLQDRYLQDRYLQDRYLQDGKGEPSPEVSKEQERVDWDLDR